MFLILFLLSFCVPVFTYSQVLQYDTKVEIIKDKKIVTRTVRLLVNKKEENDIAKMEVAHDIKAKFELEYARIFNKQGEVVRELKKKEVKTLSKRSRGAFYQDDQVERFDLYWHEYPYQIEYSYSVSSEISLMVAWWVPILRYEVGCASSSLQVELPSDFEVNISSSDLLEYEQESRDKSIVHTWRYGKVDEWEYEWYAKPMLESVPRVMIAPKEFVFDVKGSNKSWAEFGDWYDRLNSGLDALTPMEKQVVDKLLDGVVVDREKVEILYHHLQDKTTYVNVSIDKGGLKSYPASYVCENKYGDCKALTTYMKAMLGYVGIESFYTLVHAGDNIERINTDFPGAQFNHVILAVPLKTDTVFLENTVSYLPFAYQGTFTQNRLALLVKGDQSELIHIPKLKKEDVLEQSVYRYTTGVDDMATVEIVKNLRGSEFEEYRYAEKFAVDTETEEWLKDKAGLKRFRLTDWKINNGDRESAEVKVEMKGVCESPINSVTDFKVIYPYHTKIPNFESPAKRKLYVRISYPVYRRDTAIYKVSGIEKDNIQLPKEASLESDFGYYKCRFSVDEHCVQVIEEFFLESGEYSIQEYPGLYEFISSIKDFRKRSAILIQ